MLLNAYGWWKVSQITYIISLVAFGLGAVAGLGSIFLFVTGRRNKVTARGADAHRVRRPGQGRMTASQPDPTREATHASGRRESPRRPDAFNDQAGTKVLAPGDPLPCPQAPVVAHG